MDCLPVGPALGQRANLVAALLFLAVSVGVALAAWRFGGSETARTLEDLTEREAHLRSILDTVSTP